MRLAAPLFARLVASAAAAVLVLGVTATSAAAAPTLQTGTLVSSATPSSISPIAARTAGQVTADALPTVQIDGIVWSQAIVGAGAKAVVYAGGLFSHARPAGAAKGTYQTNRGNLLAYSLTTGTLVSTFAPTLNGQVLVVAASPDGTRIYVGGDFTTAGGLPRSHIAAYSTATGALLATFAPTVNGRVKSIVATNSTVYVGGMFGVANGVGRTRLAAFAASTGALSSWAPQADNTVNAMVLTPDGVRVIVGGAFQHIGAAGAYGLAAISAASGSLLPWAANSVVQDAGANSAIESLSTDGTAIFGTGYVFGPGGNLEGAFSANPSTGAVNWVEDCHGDTYSAFPMGGLLYTVSHAHYCGNIGGFPQSNPLFVNQRHALAFTTAATGAITPEYLGYTNWAGKSSPSLVNWFPDFTTANVSGATQAAWSVTGNGTYLVIGGEFPSVNGTPQQGLVRFAVPGTVTPRQGAQVIGVHADPVLVSSTPGAVRVAFPANWDRDDKTLTYSVLRDGLATPVYTVTSNSEYWNRPALGFTDSGLVPGSVHRYRVIESDADGNTYAGDTVAVTVAGASTLSPYDRDVLAAGATHYWTLADGGANLIDSAGYDDAAPTGGAVTHGVAGPVTGSGAATFDGVAAFVVDRAPVAAPASFTLGAWFKTTSTSGGLIVGFGNQPSGTSNQDDRQVYLDDTGRLHFTVGGVGGAPAYSVDRPTPANDGLWHQVVVSLGSTGMAMYVDGRLVGINQNTTTGAAFPGYWRIGGDRLPVGQGFLAGTLADIAVYPSVLTGPTVRQQFVDSGRSYPGVSAPADRLGAAIYADAPALYYRFDDTTGGIALDASGNRADGAYHGGYALNVPTPVNHSAGRGITLLGRSGSGVSSPNVGAAPTTFSTEIWFASRSVAGGALVGFGTAAAGDSAQTDRVLSLSPVGQLTFQVRPTATTTATAFSSVSGYNDGLWHHAVATMGPTGMRLFVDGALVGSNPNARALALSGYWRVGGDAGAYLAGSVDEAAVYDYALSAAQVAAHDVLAVNHPPTAALTATNHKLTATFDASASADADGTVAGYTWNYGDGGPAVSTTGATSSHVYAAAGRYSVTVTVTDDGGKTATASTTVTVVANVPPTAGLSTGIAKLALTADATTSTDSDGAITAYAFDFGDGSSASGATATHTYSAAGTYVLTLTVTDDDGATATTAATISVVANVAPGAAFTVTSTRLAATFDAGGSADTDGTVVGWAWSFGDGTGATGLTAGHTYAAAGTYPVTLTVTDNDGATGSSSQSVVVSSPVVAADAFARTVSGLWGDADTGGTWSLNGAPGLFAVTGAAATMTMSGPGAAPSAYLGSASGTDVDGTVDFSLSSAPTGGGVFVSLAARHTATSDYRVRLRLLPGTTTISVDKVVGGTETVLSQVTIPGLVYAAGTTLRVHLAIAGTSPTTITASAWDTATTAPDRWQVSATDSEPTLQGPGGVGLQTYLSGTSTPTPVTATFANLAIAAA